MAEVPRPGRVNDGPNVKPQLAKVIGEVALRRANLEEVIRGKGLLRLGLAGSIAKSRRSSL